MADEPDLPSISRQITGLDKRVTDLERARQADRRDRKESQDRIEAALAAIIDPKNQMSLTYKVNGLLEIVSQFRGVARFLKICAGIGTFAASAAAVILAVHTLWP